MVTSRAGPAAPVLCPLCLSHISAHASKQHDLPTNIATNTFWIESFYYWITLNFLITSVLVRSRGSYLTINVFCFLVKIYSILNFCAVWPTFRIVQLTWHAMGLKFAYQLFIASMEHSATNMVWLTLRGAAFSSLWAILWVFSFSREKSFFQKKGKRMSCNQINRKYFVASQVVRKIPFISFFWRLPLYRDQSV